VRLMSDLKVRPLKCSDGHDAEAFAVGCGEDLWEGLDGAGGVGDAVVEDDYGAGAIRVQNRKIISSVAKAGKRRSGLCRT